MITHSILLPDFLERRFAAIGFVKQISCTQTRDGGAWKDRIFVHNVSWPEYSCHNILIRFYIVLRDLIEVSADYYVCPPMEAACDNVRETLPVTTGKLFKGHNRYNGVRVGCDKADERLKVELSVES